MGLFYRFRPFRPFPLEVLLQDLIRSRSQQHRLHLIFLSLSILSETDLFSPCSFDQTPQTSTLSLLSRFLLSPSPSKQIPPISSTHQRPFSPYHQHPLQINSRRPSSQPSNPPRSRPSSQQPSKANPPLLSSLNLQQPPQPTPTPQTRSRSRRNQTSQVWSRLEELGTSTLCFQRDSRVGRRSGRVFRECRV